MKFIDLFNRIAKSSDLRNYGELDGLETEQLLALMRHEAHRIEKTIYNDIFEAKYEAYRAKWVRVGKIIQIVKARGVPDDEPTLVWAQQIYDAFDDLNVQFIEPNSTPPADFRPEAVAEFVDFVHARRSVRVWADVQPSTTELEALAHQLVDAARWAPTSGNRQPWRFKIMTDPDDKELLRGLKEQHCISAPLLIFLGMDRRVYGALGKDERSLYVDAGAAAIQMVLAAHKGGYGVCWNHFADDLVQSRKSNVSAYKNFCQNLGIGEHIAPVAIIAVGRPEFIPPEPARTNIDDLLL